MGSPMCRSNGTMPAVDSVSRPIRSLASVASVVKEELVSIGLSKPLTEVNDEACVRDTILHEIAHAKAGHSAGHNYQWKLVAMGLGCNPSHTCGEGVKSVAGKYQATCPCGLDHNMYRMPQRRKICRRCKASLDFKRVL